MNVVCVLVETLNDDDALAHEKLVQALVVDNAQAGNDLWTVDILGIVLVDDVWEWTAPPVEHRRVQMKQLHEQGQVMIEEHFPEPQGFLEQKELR